MTVRELIARLQTFDPDKEVRLNVSDGFRRVEDAAYDADEYSSAQKTCVEIYN